MKHANIAFFIPHEGCPNRCSFCNQNTISGTLNLPDASYVDEILKGTLTSMSDSERAVSEIAFFGGSFTAIKRDYMVSLLETAKKYLQTGGFHGIRISTRPDAVDRERLDILKFYGVTAVELGAQSMSDTVLSLNRRGHSVQDVNDASAQISQYGFSLGLQMMTGLYGDTYDGAVETAKKIINLKPDTVRIYPTVVLNGTYLGELMKSGKFVPDTLDETIELCAELMDMFENKGIRVIRVGLHDQPEVAKSFVGGAYHPALGELIMGERFYRRASQLIESSGRSDVVIAVNPSKISQMVGQKKQNLKRFSQNGIKVKIITDDSLKPDGIKLI